MIRLSDRVHHPKKITDYKDALVMLHKWDADCKELKKLAQQELAELTKRATLKAMIPEDLKRDIEKDETLKPFAKSWEFVLKQVPLRKEWKVPKKGSNDMDIGLAEKAEDPEGEGDQDAMVCKPCDEELYSLKGQGKGASAAPFQGYCSWCWGWGHKRVDCRKRLAAEAAGKGADPKGGQMSAIKGEEKGKSAWKGFQKGGAPKGGWQVKGGGKGLQMGQQKGKGGKGGGWGGGFTLNIDGGESWGSHGDGAWGQGSEHQGYDGGYDGRLWLFEECDSDGSGSSAGDMDELLVLDDSEALAVPAGDTSEELLSPVTYHSYESDLLPILPSSYVTSAKQLTKFPVVSTVEPQFASIADCYAFFSSSAPTASIVESSCPPDSATPAELRASNATFYPISTPVKKKMSPMIEHLKEKISIFGLPCAVGGADAGNAGDVYEGVDSEYECPVPDACSILHQDVAAGRSDPELAVGVYHNYSHTSNQNSLSAASCADGSSLKPSLALQRDSFLNFVSSVGEPEAEISIEMQPLSMSMDERESIRMADEDMRNGTFPDMVDSDSEPEDEREYRDAERRKMARKHGPRRPPPAPESYLIGYPPVVPRTSHSRTSASAAPSSPDFVVETDGFKITSSGALLGSGGGPRFGRSGSMRRARWKSRKTRSRMDMATGRLDRCNDRTRSRVAKDFEDFTVGELKSIVETCTETISPQTCAGEFSYFSRELPDIEDHSWMDGGYG